MADRWLIWADLEWAVVGLVADESYTVVAAPPIARYMVGWRMHRAINYLKTRGGDVQVFALKS